jgi:singapore isolate B (sub-type 7) whole genome shotgun sequence assembly, scaffold_0
MTWIERFCASPENLYMCEVDEEYIRDAFNLYGLDSDCPHYKKAISMILGSDESSSDSDSGRDGMNVNTKWTLTPTLSLTPPSTSME